jgi:hypothetical protein
MWSKKVVLYVVDCTVQHNFCVQDTEQKPKNKLHEISTRVSEVLDITKQSDESQLTEKHQVPTGNKQNPRPNYPQTSVNINSHKKSNENKKHL